MYQDPYQYFGMLEARALALHTARRRHRTALEGLDARAGARVHGSEQLGGRGAPRSETERYIAIPGQALAYKIGQLKIRELRTRAETAARRAISTCANSIRPCSADGALPLDVLEAKIDRWIAAQKRVSSGRQETTR